MKCQKSNKGIKTDGKVKALATPNLWVALKNSSSHCFKWQLILTLQFRIYSLINVLNKWHNAKEEVSEIAKNEEKEQ
jgi:hypothetical protein